MAGSVTESGLMDWTGMEQLIQLARNTGQSWAEEAEALKSNARDTLEEAYAGTAATAVVERMDVEISNAKKVFEEIAQEIERKLADQKRAYEEQNRLAEAAAKNMETDNTTTG